MRRSVSQKSRLDQIELQRKEFNCFFESPHFQTSQLCGILTPKSGIYSNVSEITLSVGTDVFKLLSSESSSDLLLSWDVTTVASESASECFTLQIEGFDEIQVDLSDLFYVGEEFTSSVSPDCFYFQFKPGLFVRSCDYTGGEISVDVEDLQPLDYKTVLNLVNQLSELDYEIKSYNKACTELQDSGIETDSIIKIKDDLDSHVRNNNLRRYKDKLAKSKEDILKTVKKNEEEANNRKQNLMQHFNSSTSDHIPSPGDYSQLPNFRLNALSELRYIFNFDYSTLTINGLKYIFNPSNDHQFLDNRHILGYCTHYIHEVSRILGVSLTFQLKPMSIYSRIIFFLSNEERIIPTTYNSQGCHQMRQYELWIIESCRNILLSVHIDHENSEDLLSNIFQIYELSFPTVSKLCPTTSITS